MSDQQHNALQQELLMLVREAVAAYSPTYREGPATAMFERAARARGLSVTHQEVDAGRFNLILSAGVDPPAVLFVGHVDTVAGSGQVRTSLDDGCLYGLGTCDMKGACVSMLLALASVRDELARAGQGAALALVVGEEEYGDGVETLCREYAIPDLVIVGEPSSLRPCLSHAGYYEARLTSHGEKRHSAVSESGVNAVRAIMEWTQNIIDQASAIEGLSVVPRRIEGGSNQFVVPDSCEIVIDLHLPPQFALTRVEALFERSRPDGYEPSRLRWSREYASEGYVIDPELKAVQSLKNAVESQGAAWNPAVFCSHSDASVLAKHARAAIVCGPGALEFAHSHNEHVPVEELVQSFYLYREIAREAAGLTRTTDA